jgi:hypothetical protein
MGKISKHNVIGNQFGLVYENCSVASNTLTLCPFSDCQTFALNSVASFFGSSKDDILYNLKYIKRKITNKKQLICNVKEEYLKRLEDFIPSDSFTIKEFYTSSNGNSMIMCLINLEFIKLDDNE